MTMTETMTVTDKLSAALALLADVRSSGIFHGTDSWDDLCKAEALTHQLRNRRLASIALQVDDLMRAIHPGG